jgi:anti-sigma regulatory factor (Ser/Thr protein kinase)
MASAACQKPGTAAPAQWPPQTHIQLRVLPTAIACVRGHVRAVACESGLAFLADTAELLASEIATNAVRASQRLTTESPVVHLWVSPGDGCLIIQVWDGSSEMPSRREAGPEADSGRGLMLVDHLAKDWGVYGKGTGKVVWVLIGGP